MQKELCARALTMRFYSEEGAADGRPTTESTLSITAPETGVDGFGVGGLNAH